MGEKIDGLPCKRKRPKEACLSWQKPQEGSGLVRHASGAEQGPSPKLPSPSLTIGPERGTHGGRFPWFRGWVGLACLGNPSPCLAVWVLGSCQWHFSTVAGPASGWRGAGGRIAQREAGGRALLLPWLTASQGGPSGPRVPWEEPHPVTRCRLPPATGVWAASPLSSCHPLSLALPPLRTVPASGPQSARSLTLPPTSSSSAHSLPMGRLPK